MEKRLVNLDFLRLFAMFLIVLQHLLDFIGVLTINTFNIKHLCVYIFESFSIVATDIFVLISGFFLIKQNFKFSKIFTLLFEVASFSWIILLFFKIFKISNFAPNSILDYIFPTFSGTYWFITCYIILYLLFPFVNKFIYSLTDIQLKFFAVITLILGCFWQYGINHKSVVWLLIVYFWGACIRLYTERKNKSFCILFFNLPKIYYFFIYFISCIIFCLLLIYSNIGGNNFVKYLVFNNIFVFIGSLYLFLFFYKVNFKMIFISKIIVLCSPAALGIYLIHMHPLISYQIVELLYSIKIAPYQYMSLNILFFSLLIFIPSILISTLLHKILVFVSYNYLCPNFNILYNCIKNKFDKLHLY